MIKRPSESKSLFSQRDINESKTFRNTSHGTLVLNGGVCIAYNCRQAGKAVKPEVVKRYATKEA